MAVYDLWLSRNGAPVTVANYIGHTGRLFYDDTNGVLRRSDGVTPGGIPIPITTATSTVAGGIKLGPGTTLNPQGQLIIDSTGLDFNFGDFVATIETDAPFGATLMSANADQDINMVSNGTGHINIIGEFNVYKTNGTVAGAMTTNPIFTVKADGQVQMLVPGADSSEGAVTIVGGLDGGFQAPVNTGVMLHITGIAGTPGIPSRVYNDSQNAFSAFVARRYNGTAAAPTAVLDGEEIMRLSGTAHNGTIIPGTGNQRIIYKALGNQTLTNQGGSIEAWVTPLNSTTIAKIATVSSTGIALESGKVLTGNVTGTADTATTVALTATNGTTATHYVTFVSTSTGNQTVRTDTDLTYNPGTNTLFVPRLQSKLYRYTRDAGIIGAGGTLTIDFSVDDVVHCTWGDGMTLAYQNYTAGSVIRLMATKTSGGNDPINLDGVTAANVSNGATTTANYTQGSTAFIEFTCIGTTIGSVYVKL